MMDSLSANAYDIAVVGSGLSATYTTIRLLERAIAQPTERPLALATIERADEFFTGIPYGQRSGTNALLITSLKDFIPSPERELFMEWLNANRPWMFDQFRSNGGSLSDAWLSTNAGAIEAGEWEELYVPRYLFGLFLKARVGELIDQAKAEGVATHVAIHGEVLDAEKIDDGFELQLLGGGTVKARRVVLAIGMPVPRSQFSSLDDSAASTACLIDDPYFPNVASNLDGVRERLAACGPEGGNVLLIGANASTMEMLFRINDDVTIATRVGRFFVASPQGTLPERLVPPNPDVFFEPRHLEALGESDVLTGRGIFEAARLDVEAGTALNLTISDTLTPVFRAMGDLISRLDHDQKLEFAGTWGSELGRFLRRAGTEYSDLVETLTRDGRLQVLKARYVGLGSATADGVRVRYAGADGDAYEHDEPMAVIFNCSGSGSLNAAGAIGLVENLVKRNLVRVNPSARGLEVDDTLQAGENLYVVGPLMSGNVISQIPVWHMEHCGRIITYGGVLANILFAQL